ncbi:alpha/beta fold hydrolase [Allokutzneria sp. NRRL B-24872]|uniref:alpha/beta fold hydrolase n=1 Tax=Allokutzneria sp. NRRL B-24872 TaxID=1137961 RepID=UPI000A3CF999|nr:alpha/beta hydrolase [Allokutzneria sp. NRRL B-24872]
MSEELSWFEDGRLAYLDVGAGEPIVLLHGGFLDHRLWRSQISAFAEGYRVIALDSRGHGASANATRPFRHTDDVAALLRHLGLGPAVLVGVSMGGGIAVDTALEHPELVRALVVCGAGTSQPRFTDPWALEVFGRWQSALAAGDAEAWLAAFEEFGVGPHRAPEDVDEAVMLLTRQMARGTIAKHTKGEPDWQVPVPDTWARLPSITVPVLAINGDLDAPDHIAMAEELARTVRNGRVATISGAAHYPNLEKPASFNEILASFLGSL